MWTTTRRPAGWELNNTWKTQASGGRAYLSSARMEVSSEEDTITLTGDIPSITPQSRLVFEAYDYLGGSEKVVCQVLSISGDNE